MDVCKFRIILALPLTILISCAPKKSVDKIFPQEKPTPSCAADVVKNEYVVSWEDGHTSIESSSEKDHFIKNFIEPQIDKIKFVETNFKIKLNAEAFNSDVAINPNDFNDWGVNAINAQYAWSRGYYGQNVKVAVIDSGLDVNHSSLNNRIAYNPAEIPDNGIDDDKNGFVDDYYGYDFSAKSGNVYPVHPHGTHVAGIIAADHNGKSKGVAPDSLIIPLNFFKKTATGLAASSGDAVLAIEYAVHKKDAKIINASWGGTDCSTSLKNSMTAAARYGVLFVIASGNEGLDLDRVNSYPNAFMLDNQINVGAISSMGARANFSNFGLNSVHILAPGENIFSTTPNETYQMMTGTSMAAPFVTGAASLLWSYKPNATVQQIKQALLQGVDTGPHAVITHGTLNVEKAFLALDEIIK